MTTESATISSDAQQDGITLESSGSELAYAVDLKMIYGTREEKWAELIADGRMSPAERDWLVSWTARRETASAGPPANREAPAGMTGGSGPDEATEGTGDGELVLAPIVLPDAFFTGSPELEHIRQKAHSKGRSATVAVAAVLTRILSMADPKLRIPDYVASPTNLSFFLMVVAGVGGGKSSGVDIATDMVSWDESRGEVDAEGYLDNAIPSTAEGMIEAHFELVEDPDNPKKKIKQQVRHNASFYFDEGESMAALGSKPGSTLFQTIRSAWMGKELGQTNAGEERRRRLPRLSYNWGLTVSIQEANAQFMLNEKTGGTTQRFLWVHTADPTIPPPKERPRDPGPLRWVHPKLGLVSPGGTRFIRYPPWFVDELMEWDHRGSQGKSRTDDLDAHIYLLTEKVAAGLALLQGRIDVDDDDIERARILVNKVSRLVVRRVASRLMKAQVEADREAGERAAVREDAKQSAKEEAVKARILTKIGKNSSLGRDTTWHEISTTVGRDRKHVEQGDLLQALIDKGEVRIVGQTQNDNPIFNLA